MVRRQRAGALLALGLVVGGVSGFGPSPAWAQVRERDVTITGPRGRSVERHLESRIGPGGVDRQMTIRRPGGTFERDVHFGRGPTFAGGQGFYPGPRGPGFIERDVIINRGGGGNALGAGLIGAAIGTGAGMLLGSALASPPPPPPVYVAPSPLYVAPGPAYVVPAPPPAVIVNPPVRYQQRQATVVVDEVDLAIGRLQSAHEASRRDACAELGRMGDARAIPALIDRLKHDTSKHVRATAATAIGQVGDPGTSVILQRAITYDKKQEVRDAAAAALAMMPQPAASAPVSDVSTTFSEPAIEPIERVPPPPSPAGFRR